MYKQVLFFIVFFPPKKISVLLLCIFFQEIENT